MLATFVARYSLTNDGLQNLLNILGLLLPKDSQLPPTTFLFKKCLPKSNIETKYFCPSCHEPIMEENQVIKCPCSGVEEQTKSDLFLNGCFYLYMSVADQLKFIYWNLLGLGIILNVSRVTIVMET
jgi:hypothetical protein